MAKDNRATRKQLETVVQKIIEELGYLKQMVVALDNYLGAYVKYKEDTVPFNRHIAKLISEQEKNQKNNPDNKEDKSAKSKRYKNIATPPL